MKSLSIKSWSSPDVDPFRWEPEGDSDVCFLLEIEIGETDDERADLFTIQIATPEGLRTKLSPSGGVLADRAMLVLSEYSWHGVQRTIQQLVQACAAPTWNESVLRLQRYFRWEYEDYTRQE